MQIYYYTRTNRSKKIAEELAEKYNLKCNQISDDEKWKGALNFLKGGAMASSKKVIHSKYAQPVENKKIILVFPVWAGSFPPAVRDFIEKNKEYKIIAITTSLGTPLKEAHTFEKMTSLIGKEISIENIDLN